MKADNKLYKGSKTTYSGWCERYGFKWCQGFLPQEWLDEQRTVKFIQRQCC